MGNGFYYLKRTKSRSFLVWNSKKSKTVLIWLRRAKALSMALQTDYDLILLNAVWGYDGPGFCREAESD